MKYTENFNLKKPDGDEFYDVEDFNANAEIIDGELKRVNDLAINFATQAEAKAGTNNSKLMTPLRVKEAIAANEKYNNYLPLAGGKMTGNVTFEQELADIMKSNEVGRMSIYGGTGNWQNGGTLFLYGKGHTSKAGYVELYAHNGSEYGLLQLTPNGVAKFKGKNVVRSINNIEADNAGNVTLDVAPSSHTHNEYAETEHTHNYLPLGGGTLDSGLVLGSNISKNSDTSHLTILSSTAWGNGAGIQLVSQGASANAGNFILRAKNSSDYADLIGTPNGTLTFKGKNIPTDAIDYIIESYRNGTEWYEVYKSGKVRQGGIKAAPSSENQSYQITLHKPFADTDYSVLCNGRRSSRTETAWEYTHSFTTTSFKVVSPGSTAHAWVAEGQGA